MGNQIRGGKHGAAWALIALIAGLQIGCPGPTTMPPGNNNGNDNGNEPPPARTVPVTVDGMGDVDQSADGDIVTLTATPADGWEFVGWTGSMNSTDNPLTITADDSTTLTAQFMERSEPPPMPDADGDDVPDLQDECDETPTGAEVDERGCSAEQRDADGDRVIDDNDDCPGTPNGANVDENGCAPSQRDTDGDSVRDSIDQCEGTPPGTNVDALGCPSEDPDSDGDDVPNAEDDCPGTPEGEAVNEAGCSESQLDDDNDNVSNDRDLCANTAAGAMVNADGCSTTQRDTDGDTVLDANDQCPGTPAGRAVDATGCPLAAPPGGGPGGGNPDPPDENVCGRTSNGDCFNSHGTPGCNNEACCAMVCAEDAFCCDLEGQWDNLCAQTAVRVCEGGGNASNDSCSTPLPVMDGQTTFSNLGATTDGPDDGGTCSSFDIAADVWFCYRASCNGFATISLCGSQYDTAMSVYQGCACPEQGAGALGCSDDDCGFGLESRSVVPVTAGSEYLIRVGGFPGNNMHGTGTLTIACAPEPGTIGIACVAGAGDCFGSHANPGCENVSCCTTVCEMDPFCCDVEWDDFCSREANGLCEGGSGFTACTNATNVCNATSGSPGCSNQPCCESVCTGDPFCCLVEWDSMCVNRAASCP